MRIAIGGFCHETNMFGNVLIDMEKLRRGTSEGEDLIRWYTGHHSYVGGYIDEAAAQSVELVPTRMSAFKPSGPCVPEGVDLSRDRLVELLCKAHQEAPLDAIALFMHGGGAAVGHPDPEGEVILAIREKLGYDIPIGVALDLHGNITEEMMTGADLLVGCKQYPHIDEYDQGRNMFRILCDMVRNNYRPAKKLVRLPWHMVPAEGCTATEGPARAVMELCLAAEREDPDMIQASFFHGFPYADVPGCCVSVTVMAKTQESADRNALKIARFAWQKRRVFRVPIYSSREAVDKALQAPEGPVIIHESSDNPGGGAPGDGTHLLRELLRRDIPSAVGFIYDPEVVAQAMAAGVGTHMDCLLGGKTDDRHGEPVELKNAYVKSISDGRFVQQSPMGYGNVQDIGYTVCLVVGNVEIVVAGGTKDGAPMNRTQIFDDGPFRIAGVDWQHTRVIALKSAQHFKGWWSSRIPTMISCESPGLMSADLHSFAFRYLDRSYFPLEDARWEGES